MQSAYSVNHVTIPLGLQIVLVLLWYPRCLNNTDDKKIHINSLEMCNSLDSAENDCERVSKLTQNSTLHISTRPQVMYDLFTSMQAKIS